MQWQKRRWRIFVSKYNNDLKFKNQVDKIKGQKFDIENKELVNLHMLFLRNGVPVECIAAAIVYINSPNQPEEDIVSLIKPPFSAFSVYKNKKIPEYTTEVFDTIIDYFHYVVNTNLSKEHAISISKVDLKNILTKLFGAHIVITLDPVITKSEVIEIINKYWDEISTLGTNELPYYSKHLVKRVESTQPEGQVRRNKLIMELHHSGLNAKKISAELQFKYGYPHLSESNIRVIISRQKRTK